MVFLSVPDVNQPEGGVKEKEGIAPTLLALKDFFPSLIEVPEAGDDYSPKASPFIKVNLDVDKSYLMKPPPASSSKDTVGTWPASQLWPTSDKYFTPSAGESESANALEHKIPSKLWMRN